MKFRSNSSEIVFKEGLPFWLSEVRIHKTTNGKWSVRVIANTWGRPFLAAPSSGKRVLRLTPAKERHWRDYYLNGDLSPEEARNEASHKALGMKSVSNKHRIIKITRDTLSQHEAQIITARYRAKYGEDFIWIPKAQKELCKELGI